MTSDRATRESTWARLDAILDVAERRSVRALSDDDLIALPSLYRATLSALSVARETSLDADLIAYLEGLSARAYFFVYGVRTGLGGRLRRFILYDWPAAVRDLADETAVAAALMLAGVVLGYVLVNVDPGWFAAFVPTSLAGGRDPTASTASLRATLYDSGGNRSPLATLATFLFTHNAQVAIGVFALGFAFGLPTVILLITTGAMVGAFVALFVAHGLGVAAGGWLLIHGTTELFAIVIAAAAGLRIGRAIAFPGSWTRLTAAHVAGRQAARAMIGVVIMLSVAGMLEGFARQLVRDDAPRYAVAATMLLIWLAFFYWPRPFSRSNQ